MTKVIKKIVVPYTTDQMLDLVSDVQSYPEFIPWIRSLRVDEKFETSERNIDQLRATAAVGFKGFSETFTTDVETNGFDKRISVSLVRGPFKKLRNLWHFEAHAEGCLVRFEIDFEFSNFVLQALFKANFERAVGKLIAEFLKEAKRRYPVV